jgi:hypothetical protein
MKTLQTALIAAAALAATAVGLSAPTANAADTRAYVQVDLGRGGYDRDDRGFGRGGYDRDGFSLDRRIDDLQRRIDLGVRSRQLSGREADRLYDRLNSIERTKRSYERSGRGLDGREVAMLNDSLDRLSADIRYQGHDNNRW